VCAHPACGRLTLDEAGALTGRLCPNDGNPELATETGHQIWAGLDQDDLKSGVREHTGEQGRLNLPTGDHENTWETVETIDLWVVDRKSVGCRFDSFRAHHVMYFQVLASALILKLSIEKVRCLKSCESLIPNDKSAEHLELGNNCLSMNPSCREPSDCPGKGRLTQRLSH
jgi:hypothetical protein